MAIPSFSLDLPHLRFKGTVNDVWVWECTKCGLWRHALSSTTDCGDPTGEEFLQAIREEHREHWIHECVANPNAIGPEPADGGAYAVLRWMSLNRDKYMASEAALKNGAG